MKGIMAMKISENDRKWSKEMMIKTRDKLEKVINRSGEKIPYTTNNGSYDDKYNENPTWWTNGFWPGIILYMYQTTQNEKYLNKADLLEKKMDNIFIHHADKLNHDVGFMWYLSSGKKYELTKDEASKKRMLLAANLLLSRFSIKGQFLSAWNGVDKQGWSIIDSMMNLALLFKTTQVTGISRYKDIAIAHANSALNNFIREDGSVNHIVVYDVESGNVIETKGGQGYGIGSSWTRGQAWAINGFAQVYGFTKDEKYINAAKRVAHYFIASIAESEYVAPIDFRSPKTPTYWDTTANVIAASGLLEIAKYVDDNEKSIYFTEAIKVLKALENEHLNFEHAIDHILMNGSEAYSHGIHKSIIYGDYYWLEALIKLEQMIE